MPFQFVEIPKNLECPITCDIMVDPVFTADGETYERAAITTWLKENNTSPKTNEILEHKSLTPNRALKSQILDFVDNNRQYFEKEFMDTSARGDLSVLTLITKLGININLKDNNGWTALHHAAQNNRQDIVQFLNDAGLDLNTASATVNFQFSNQLLLVNEKIKSIKQQKIDL